MLTKLVDAGDLPPVAQRVPKQPYVVQPGLLFNDEFVGFQPGTFSEVLRLPHNRPDSDIDIIYATIEPLLWAPGGFGSTDGFEGNVVAGYEANADDTVFTFHLREGLRWSDGAPVTTEDVRFAIDDVFHNEQINPSSFSFANYLRTQQKPDGAPASLEVIDDMTFSLAFDAPYPSFPAMLAGNANIGYGDIFMARHYMEPFHEKYADQTKLKELLAEEDMAADQWVQLFNLKRHWYIQNITTPQVMGHPTLTPWIMIEARDDVVRYERNPYYFKVDPAGNQLPYVDELRAQVATDPETFVSRALFGEFDYSGTRLSLRHLPLIADKADADEVSVLIPQDIRIRHVFDLNLTHEDESWRQVVRDVRFRRALSLAINREEILNTFYLGEFGFVSEELNPPDHDPDEADRLLDEMGLQRNGDGLRLGPDGDVFTIPFEIYQGSAEDTVPVAELVIDYWKNIGIQSTIKQVDAGTTTADAGGRIKARIGPVETPSVWRTGFKDTYLPGDTGSVGSGYLQWATLWRDWHTSRGENGEEPPAEIQELFQLHEQFVSSAIGSPEREEAIDGIIQNYHSNLWVIVPVEVSYLPTFFSTHIQNTPAGTKVDELSQVSGMSMEQWYAKQS